MANKGRQSLGHGAIHALHLLATFWPLARPALSVNKPISDKRKNLRRINTQGSSLALEIRNTNTTKTRVAHGNSHLACV